MACLHDALCRAALQLIHLLPAPLWQLWLNSSFQPPNKVIENKNLLDHGKTSDPPALPPSFSLLPSLPFCFSRGIQGLFAMLARPWCTREMEKSGCSHEPVLLFAVQKQNRTQSFPRKGFSLLSFGMALCWKAARPMQCQWAYLLSMDHSFDEHSCMQTPSDGHCAFAYGFASSYGIPAIVLGFLELMVWLKAACLQQYWWHKTYHLQDAHLWRDVFVGACLLGGWGSCSGLNQSTVVCHPFGPGSSSCLTRALWYLLKIISPLGAITPLKGFYLWFDWKAEAQVWNVRHGC